MSHLTAVLHLLFNLVGRCNVFCFSKTEYSQRCETVYFLYCVIHIDSRDGVVGIVTRLRPGSSGSESSKCYSVGIGGSLPSGTVGGS